MAGIKQRGPQSVQNKRYHNGKELRPTMWVYPGGRSIMTGTIKETDEVVLDENGKPIPWQALG